MGTVWSESAYALGGAGGRDVRVSSVGTCLLALRGTGAEHWWLILGRCFSLCVCAGVQTCPTHQVSVENLPDVKGYASSDAFVKHPTVEGLFKMYVVPDGHVCCSESLIIGVYSVGRLDDVLIHSSGEKTVPAPMETLIGSSPLLSSVCMFGRGRSQTGVLVEPRPEHAINDVTDDDLLAEFRNKMWCVCVFCCVVLRPRADHHVGRRDVEEANKEAPAFSRIFKEMILVTSKEKPMLRTGKGTVMKKATMKSYESEIDAL